MARKNVAKYIGRYAEVRVPVLGDVVVENGVQVEVEDDDVFLSLLEQPSNWEWVSGVKLDVEPDTEEGEAE